MKKLLLIVLVGLLVYRCGSKDQTEPDEIPGEYVREYSFKVTNPESGAEVGMRTVRDTIFIKNVEKKFEVSNHRWAKNNYDDEGWRNMEHADDRPLHTFTGIFNEASKSIHPLAEGLSPILTIDFDHATLFTDESKSKSFSKLK